MDTVPRKERPRQPSRSGLRGGRHPRAQLRPQGRHRWRCRIRRLLRRHRYVVCTQLFRPQPVSSLPELTRGARDVRDSTRTFQLTLSLDLFALLRTQLPTRDAGRRLNLDPHAKSTPHLARRLFHRRRTALEPVLYISDILITPLRLHRARGTSLVTTTPISCAAACTFRTKTSLFSRFNLSVWPQHVCALFSAEEHNTLSGCH